MRSHTKRSQRARSLKGLNEDEQASARSVDNELIGQSDCQGPHADVSDRASIAYHTNAGRHKRCWTVPILLAVVLSIAVFLISTPSSVLSHSFTENFFVTKTSVGSMVGGVEDHQTTSENSLRPHSQQKKTYNNNSISKKADNLRAVLHHDGSSPCYPHHEGKLRGRRAYEHSTAKEIELLNTFFFATNCSRQEESYDPIAPLLLCLWEIDSLLHTSSVDPFIAEEDMYRSLALALLRGEEDAAISMNATQKHMPQAMKKALADASVGSSPWTSNPCREFAHGLRNFIDVPKTSQKRKHQETDDGIAEPLRGTIAFEILARLRAAAKFNAETFFIRDHTSSQSSSVGGDAKKSKAGVDHTAYSPSSQQDPNRSRREQVACVRETPRQIWPPPASSSGDVPKKGGLPSSGRDRSAADYKQVRTSDRFGSRIFSLSTLAHPSCVAEQLMRELHEQAIMISPHIGKEGEVPRPNKLNRDRKYTLNDDAPLLDDVDMFYKYPNAKLNCFKHGGHDPGVRRTSQSSSAEINGKGDLNVHGHLNDASSIYESEGDRRLLLKNVLYFRGILYVFDESQEDNEEKNKNDGRSEPTSLVFNYAPSFSMIKGNWPQPIFGNLSVRRISLPSLEFGAAAAVRASDDAFSASSSKDDSGSGSRSSSSSFSSLSAASSLFPPNVAAAIAERFLRTPSSAIKSVNALRDSTPTVGLTDIDEIDTDRRAAATTTGRHTARILDVPVAYWQPPTDFNSHYHTLVELTMPAFQSILNFWESDMLSMEPSRINCRREHSEATMTAEAVVQKKENKHAFDLAHSTHVLKTLEDNPLLVMPPKYWAQFLHKSPSAEVKRRGMGRSRENTDTTTTFLLRDKEDEDKGEDTSLSFGLPFLTLQAQPSTLLLPPSLMITSRPVRAGFVKNFAPLKRSKKTKVAGGRGGGRDAPASASSLLSSAPKSFSEEVNSARTCRYAPLPQYAAEVNSLWSNDHYYQTNQLIDKSEGSSGLGVTSSSSAAKEDFKGERRRPGEDNCLNTMLGRMTTSVLGSGVGSDWGEKGIGGGGVYGVAAHHHQFADPANLGAFMDETSVAKTEQPSLILEDVHSSKITSFNPPRSSSDKATLGAAARRRTLLNPYSSASRQSPRREEAFFVRNLLVGNPTHCEPLWGPDPFYSEVLAQDQYLRGTLYTRRLFKKPHAASPRTGGLRGQGEGDAETGQSVREDSSLVLSSPSQLRAYETFLASYTDCQRFLWSFRNYYLQAVTPIVSVNAATLPSQGGSVMRSHSAEPDHGGKIGSKHKEEIAEGPTEIDSSTTTKKDFFYRELLSLSSTARKLQYHTGVQYKDGERRREESSSSFFFSKLLAAGSHLGDQRYRFGGEDKTPRHRNPKEIRPKPSLIPAIYDHPVDYGAAQITVSSDGGERGVGRAKDGSGCAKGKEADDIVILFTSRKGDWARELTNEKFVVKKLEEHLANRGRQLVEVNEENSPTTASSFSKLFPSTVSFAKHRRALGRKYLSAKVLVKKFTDSKQLEHQLLHADQLDVNKTTLFIGNHGANYIPSLFLRPNAGVITMSFSTPGFYPFAVFPKWLHWRDIHIEQDCNRRLYRGKCKWSSGNNNDMAVSFPHQMGRLLELIDDVIVQQVLHPREGLL